MRLSRSMRCSTSEKVARMPRPHRITTSRGARALRALGLAVLAPLLAGVLLAACGGSGSSSVSSAAAKEQSREQKAETKFADFARCLREHGVNAEALSHPGGGHGLKIMPGSGGPAAMEAAEKACARYRPEKPQKGSEPPQVKVEHEEALQRFAKCMREHGIKVEASPSGGVFFQRKPGSGGPNPESPGFVQAQSACQKLLPGGGPEG
jgi:hypothetical protein